MSEDKETTIMAIFWCVLAGLAVIVAVACIILKIYALINYADTPIAEAPVWVVWILQDGGRTT